MKKIIICGSISVAENIIRIQQELVEFGYEVQIPEGVKRYIDNGYRHISSAEMAQDKIKYDLIRGYYQAIQASDIVLIVNPEKKGIAGYIGGNTFLEMGFAHVLGKPLYVLYPIARELPYTDEIGAMQPIVLDGTLDKFQL